MKKYSTGSFLVLSIIGLVFGFTPLVPVALATATTTVATQTMTISQLVELLISVGVITPDKAAIARTITDSARVELSIPIAFQKSPVLNSTTTLPTAPGYYSDVTYCKIKDTGLELKLDYIIPSAPKSLLTPAVVVVHGGGWIQGDKTESQTKLMAQVMAQAGYFVANINYRLTGPAVSTDPEVVKYQVNASLQDSISDVGCAFRWVRGMSPYFKVDPNRVIVFGSSAGAHLALMNGLAGNSADFKSDSDLYGSFSSLPSAGNAIIDYYGASDLTLQYQFESTTHVNDTTTIEAVGATLEQDPDLYYKLSPLNYFNKSSPPLITFHGNEDSLVTYRHSQLLDQKASTTRALFEFVTVNGADHGFTTFNHQKGGCEEVNEYNFNASTDATCLDLTAMLAGDSQVTNLTIDFANRFFSDPTSLKSWGMTIHASNDTPTTVTTATSSINTGQSTSSTTVTPSLAPQAKTNVPETSTNTSGLSKTLINSSTTSNPAINPSLPTRLSTTSLPRQRTAVDLNLNYATVLVSWDTFFKLLQALLK